MNLQQDSKAKNAVSNPIEELIELVVFWAVIWIPTLLVCDLSYHWLRYYLSRGWSLGIEAALFFVLFFSILFLVRKYRAKVQQLKPVLILVMGFLAGYYWSGFQVQQSDGQRTLRAYKWACHQSPSCLNNANNYIGD